jgi:tetratricopeptide (TPR) repeat protein
MNEVFDGLKYAQLIQGKQHDEAIVYVDKFRKLAPDDDKLKHWAALARGGKCEHILGSGDQLGITPTKTRVDEMIAILNEAIDLDPSIPDLHWNLAVIHARFLHDLSTAARYLNEAKKRGYDHPMMKKLEQMIGSTK